MSEQHNQGLDAEREVADLPAEFLASDGSAETNNNPEAGEAQASEEAPKTAARATGGLAKLVEERVEQRERDEDRDDAGDEEEVQEEQVAAAAGGSEAPVEIVEVVEALDGISETFARAAEPAAKSASALGDDGSPSALLLGLGALGLVGAAIVIAADDGDDDVSLPDPPPPPPPPPANTAPMITSDAAFAIDENLDAGTVVFTAMATDAEGDDIAFSLSGDDAAAFAVDPMTGVVTTVAPLDFETQASYTVTLTATDSEGAATTQDVTITVNDVAEAVTVSLDVDSDGMIATAEPFSAASDDIVFTDSATVESNAEITGFDTGDRIQVDADPALYAFTSSDDGSSATLDDLVISINNNGVVSQITIQDVVADGALVFDEASAEAAVGADFFGDGPPAPPPPPPPPPGTGGAVDGDVDDDAMPSTPVIFDAGGDALIFTDDVDTASNFVIQNASADDFVQILNGDPSDYAYTSSGTDLIVSFNNNGVVNQIVVEDAVLAGALVFDEASAEAALGNNFNNGMPIDFFQAG